MTNKKTNDGNVLDFGQPTTPSKEDKAQAALQAHLDDVRKERDDYKTKFEASQEDLKTCNSNLKTCEINHAQGNGVCNQMPLRHFLPALIALMACWIGGFIFQTGVKIGENTLIAATPLSWGTCLVMMGLIFMAILTLCGRCTFPSQWLSDWFSSKS